ncbi:MAG: prealbumin-like fold domain-containing protein [Bifidobacterium dentium]
MLKPPTAPHHHRSVLLHQDRCPGQCLAGADFEIEGQNGASTPSTATATSDSNGTVTFKGLADGTYKVTETNVPAGFQQNLKAAFTVTIANGKAVK